MVLALKRRHIPYLTPLLRSLTLTLALTLPHAHADARQDYLNRSLQYACWEGKTAEVQKLLARGAQINAQPGACLSGAISQRHPAVVTMLIERGANVNVPGYRGYTSIMDAVEPGEADVVKALLKAGADPNYTSRERATALIWAAHWNLIGDVRELVPRHPQLRLSGSSIRWSGFV